jgi:hypothetical protein
MRLGSIMKFLQSFKLQWLLIKYRDDAVVTLATHLIALIAQPSDYEGKRFDVRRLADNEK